jgi:predicted site-specific integrase-resolvase
MKTITKPPAKDTPKNQKVPTRYMRLIDWAKEVGVPIKTARKWVQARRIPVIKVSGGILIDPRDAEEAIQRFKVKAIQ